MMTTMMRFMGSEARRSHSLADGKAVVAIARPGTDSLPCSSYQATNPFGWTQVRKEVPLLA